jgi:3',5'-cyclic AMP phosphodiesterase CpdA
MRPGGGSVTDPVSSPTEAFVLAHLSDVHLGPLPPIPLQLLNAKRAVGAINWYRKRRFIHDPEIAGALARDVVSRAPDHTAVSGDLTNLGLASEIERGAQWLGQLGAPASVSVVPGNHDIYSKVHGRRCGVDALTPWAAHFTACAEGRGYGGMAPFPFVRCMSKGAMRIALIGLNSSLETPPMIAIGTLGVAQLQALAGILDRTRAEGFTRVVVLHHPPLPGLSAARHDLTDAAALATILKRHGAELVIHGHNHQRMVNRCDGADGVIPIVGVPSASAGRTKGDEPLARAHTYLFHPGPSPQRPRITLIARGLTTRGGGISEIERTEL